MVLEICNERLTPLKVDFFSSFPKMLTCLTAKRKYLMYLQIPLHNDPSPISSTRASHLKLDDAECKDILENFKERSKN